MTIESDTDVLKLRQAPIDIPTLARVPLKHTASLPASKGVYFAVDDAERVWYVGIADSIRDRINGHDRLADFQEKGVTRLAWQPEVRDSERRSLEKECIEFFHPPLNFQHNFSKLPEIDFGLRPAEEIERFLWLRAQLKVIELEIDKLQPNIVTRCEEAGGMISHILGSIRRQEFKSWQFSDEVELAKLKLSQMQKEEKQNGKATVKSVKVSPVARLNADALNLQVANLLSGIRESVDRQPEGFSEEQPI